MGEKLSIAIIVIIVLSIMIQSDESGQIQSGEERREEERGERREERGERRGHTF